MGIVVSFCTPEKIDSTGSLIALLHFFLTIQGGLNCKENCKRGHKNYISFFHRSNVTFSYEI